jgi:hypothetical protein
MSECFFNGEYDAARIALKNTNYKPNIKYFSSLLQQKVSRIVKYDYLIFPSIFCCNTNQELSRQFYYYQSDICFVACKVLLMNNDTFKLSDIKEYRFVFNYLIFYLKYLHWFYYLNAVIY